MESLEFHEIMLCGGGSISGSVCVCVCVEVVLKIFPSMKFLSTETWAYTCY